MKNVTLVKETTWRQCGWQGTPHGKSFKRCGAGKGRVSVEQESHGVEAKGIPRGVEKEKPT